MQNQEFLDWNKLPPELRYLPDFAVKYGYLQFDDRIEALLESLTPTQHDELIQLGELISRDWKLIDEWISNTPITENPESRLVYFTCHLLGLGSDLGIL